MNRLLLALPLYTHVSTLWLINFLQLDRTHVVDTIAVRKMYLAAAMNLMVEAALKSEYEWDRLVVYEADMTPKPWALNRIAAYPDHLDIVGATYHQHPFPHHPVSYTQVDEDHFSHLTFEQVEQMMAAPGIYPLEGAVGFGFTAVHRRVFEKWDSDVVMFGGENQLGHDMWFAREARRQGFGVSIDSGQPCGHLTEVEITYADYVRAHAELNESPSNTGGNNG